MVSFSLFKGLITRKICHCVIGQVVGGPDRVPVKNVKVIFRKKVVDRTNEEGKFSFVISDDVDRVVVTFHDPTDQFFNTTQTVPIPKGQTVSHISIALPEEDPPVTFDSSQDLRVPLGHAGDSMAELELPADNLLHKDGKPFKGEFQDVGCQFKGFSLQNRESLENPRRTFLNEVTKQTYWHLIMDCNSSYKRKLSVWLGP